MQPTPKTPDSIIEKLSNLQSKDEPEFWLVENIRYKIASRPNLPTYIIEKLILDDIEWVRAEIALHNKLSKSMLEILVKDKSTVVRSKLASRPNLPFSLIERLAEDPQANVRAEIANRNDLPVTPLEVINKIIDNLLLIRYTVNTRVSVASKSCQYRIIKYFAKDSKIKARRAVASNPQCPNSILEKLLENNEPTIHQALLNHPNSSDRLKQIIRFVLGLETATVELLSILADSPHYYLKKLVAKDIKTTSEVLLKLASDRDYRICKTLLFRNDLNLEIIDRILEVTLDKFISRKTAFKVSKENYILCAIARYPQRDRFSNGDKQNIFNKLNSFLDSNLGDSYLIHGQRIKNTIEANL